VWQQAALRPEVTTTTFPPVERVVLDLKALGGVTVTTHASDEIGVEQWTESTMRDVAVEMTVAGDELTITSTRCRGVTLSLVNRCSASFVLAVPASTVVYGEIAHGDIRLDGLASEVHLTTGHGDVRAIGTSGSVTLATGHGSAYVSGVDGDLTVTTGHGTIEVTDTRSEVVALTSGHGGIDFSPATAPVEAVLTTSHGPVHVALPLEAPPVAVSTDASGHQVDLDIATDPNADHRLDVTTGRGRIEISYADS
jgi:DUF4097 and DUF4098 domain-containing protein YvlB